MENISKSLLPKVILSARFVSFHRSNLKSRKSCIRLLANVLKSDQRTSYGQNLKNISNECDTVIDDLTANVVKKQMTYRKVPDDEKWRCKMVDELIGAIYGHLDIPLDLDEINLLLNHICSS